AGTTVKGAYDVLVSMMVIAVLLPFLLLFSSAIKLSAAAPGPGEIRIPGGRGTITAMAIVGLLTTTVSIVLAAWPRPDEPDQVLAFIKVIGGTAVMVGTGAILYLMGTGRARRAAAVQAEAARLEVK
ncbi:MAG: hypothetical protein ACREXP_31435, partial [Steroidobacteraceae bacterium]